MPLPSTQVFHPEWAARVAPTNASTFNVAVKLTTPGGGGGWDPDTGPTPDTPIELFSGPARLTYEPTQGRDADAAGQRVSSRRAKFTLTREALSGTPLETNPGLNGVRVEVTARLTPNAPADLVGRVFYVETASWSSHTWELLLDAIDDQTNQTES